MRLIDADALMEVIREHDYPLRSHINSTDNGMFTLGIQQAVDEAPTIDAVPVVRGEWINKPKTCVFICSMCGREVKTFHTNDIKVVNDEYPFCHCGAKMDGERRESEERE